MLGELGEPPHLPHLVELPARGPGADLVGRSAALLVDLPVDLQPSGWRLVDRPGRDLERAQAFLRQDLDVLAEVADGYRGPFKVQVTGPWTLAASLWLPRLERAVVDPGACRDLADSLAEGVRRHVAEVRRLLPGAHVVLQVDEPGLPGVLAGELPTASGFGRLRAVQEPVAAPAVSAVVEAGRQAGAEQVVLHCCADRAPVTLMQRTGADALSVDVARLGRPGWEAMAVAIEAGVRLWAGVLSTAGALESVPAAAEALARPWAKLGLLEPEIASVVVTPTCGLAGLTPEQARARLTRAREVAAHLLERAQG